MSCNNIFSRPALMFLCLLFVLPANAHHVLGRPSYSLSEDSTTPPGMQMETQIGSYLATYMAFPAFPSADEVGRVNLYISDIKTNEPYLGEVTFKTRDDTWLSSREETLGIQQIDDNVYRQRFMFKEDGDYIITAEFEADGEFHQIDFPLRIGEASSINPTGWAIGLIAAVLLGVSIINRKRIKQLQVSRHRDELNV